MTQPIAMKKGVYGSEWPEIQCPNPECEALGWVQVEVLSHLLGDTDLDAVNGSNPPILTWKYENAANYLIGLWCSRCSHDFTPEEEDEVGVALGDTFYHTAQAAAIAMLKEMFGVTVKEVN